jgi:hypothetical protein
MGSQPILPINQDLLNNNQFHLQKRGWMPVVYFDLFSGITRTPSRENLASLFSFNKIPFSEFSYNLNTAP